MAEHAVPSSSALPSSAPRVEPQEPATEQAALTGGASAAPPGHVTATAAVLPSVSSGQLFSTSVTYQF